MPARPRDLIRFHEYEDLDGFEGVVWCPVCQCVEGTFLSSCPGYPLSSESQDDIMSGKVRDLQTFRERRATRRRSLKR